MNIRFSGAVLACALWTNTSAADLAMCSAGGFYAGANNHFLSDLAMRIAQKRGVLGGLECTALWKNAVEIGERASKTGQVQPSDTEVIKQATDFSGRVYEAVAKAAGYAE